jgi:hypothetical protein
MAVTVNEIMTLGGRQLPFARDLREAVAIYMRRTWPLNTAGCAAQAWGIPKTTAKSLMKGHASDATMTAVLRAGGWPLAIAVIGATIGERLEDFIQAERKSLEREAQQREREARELATIEAALFRRPVADVGAGSASADRGPAARGALAYRLSHATLGGPEAGAEAASGLTDDSRK